MKNLYTILFILLSYQSFSAAPTVPASNLHFSIIDGGYINLGWTNGNGARRVIICKAGSPVTFIPQNGVDYTENTNYGSGQQVAPGEYVIYDNAFTSFYLTGLTAATQYYFAVFEYNGTGVAIEYLTTSFLTGNATTAATPTVQVSNASFSNITTNSATVSWTNGNGQRRLVVVRESSPVSADPVNNQQYNVNSAFGSGATIGAGNYTVYASTGNAVTVTNLNQGTSYYFSIYEYNGNSQPQYKTPAYTATVTTRSVPTVASSNVTITRVDGKELAFNWTNGNGQRRIIVAKQGSNVTSVPVNGTDYTANSVFGSGQNLGAGEYVVFDDNFNAATVTGLIPATTYYFKIFEYDGTGSNTTYLTGSFGAVSSSTAVTPTVQATNPATANVTSSSLSLAWTKGNGRARTVIGRKDAPVNVTPQDFLTYTANSDFGLGQNLGNGNYVVTNTTEAFINIHNLEANSTYYFAIFEYNGFNQPLYLSPAVVINATTSAPLPVKLIKWEAIPLNNKVSLQWTTSSEINASYFIIERSSDGVYFASFATVAATGNSQSDVYYSKDDINPLPGKSYYRLKMVDIDGKFEYSPVRSVLFSANQSVILMRNPVQSILEVVTSAAAVSSKSEWQILNIKGQLLKRGVISSARTGINVSALPPGHYWIRLNINHELQALQFIKQ